MRLLLTTDTVGGVWTYTCEMVEGLLEAGDSVALVSFGREPSASQGCWVEGLSARWGERFRYEASSGPLEWMGENETAYKDGAELLLRVVQEFGAELLHCNQFCYGRLPVGVPRLVVAHSDVLSWAAACRPEGLERSAWLDRYLELVRDGLRGASALVAPTQWMLDALADAYDLPSWRRVIPNGRKVVEVTGRERELRAVCAGRVWDEAKGISMLSEVRSPMPIVVAGEVEFEGTGVQAGFPPEVSFAGAMSGDQVLDLMRASAVYLVTSIYEPFGLAALEAGISGCAVVARDIPSLREVWGDAALYFRDAAGLSGVLELLAADEAQLRLAQERSAERAREFPASRMVRAYREMYADLIRLQTPGRGAAAREMVVSCAS